MSPDRAAITPFLAPMPTSLLLGNAQELVEGYAPSPARVVSYADLPRNGGKVAFLHRDSAPARHAWARPAAVSAPGAPGCAGAVEQERVARGVARTPTVFVNGRPFIETFTLERIPKGIDQALAKTK